MGLFGPPGDWRAAVDEALTDLATARDAAGRREAGLTQRIADLENEVKALKESEDRIVERVSTIVFNRTQEARKLAALRRREEKREREYDGEPRMPAL